MLDFLGRYFMFNVTFNFGKVNAKKNGNIEKAMKNMFQNKQNYTPDFHLACRIPILCNQADIPAFGQDI